MIWSEAFDSINRPDGSDISKFIDNDLWDKLRRHIEIEYGAAPKIEYSKCSMQRGWNIKYKKNGRALCTLYPMEGFFIALVVIGGKEANEAEQYFAARGGYAAELYKKTPCVMGGRWLMLEVRDEGVLEDVKRLIKIRADQKQSNGKKSKV